MSPSSKLIRAFVTACIAFAIVGSVCGFLAVPLDQQFFPQSAASAAGAASNNGPLLVAAFVLAIWVGLVVFFYGVAPEAAIWKYARGRLQQMQSRRRKR